MTTLTQVVVKTLTSGNCWYHCLSPRRRW